MLPAKCRSAKRYHTLLEHISNTVVGKQDAVVGMVLTRGGGGGHSGTEWLPAAKQPPRAEAVNVKI